MERQDIKTGERKRDNKRQKYWTVGKVYTREIQTMREKGMWFEEGSKKLRRLKKHKQ